LSSKIGAQETNGFSIQIWIIYAQWSEKIQAECPFIIPQVMKIQLELEVFSRHCRQ
jgi:hypothetical protein